MAKNLTTADKCLTLLVAVLVTTNIILACSIGLILPRHITKDGWIYIDNMDGVTNESLRISCTCIRTIVKTKNETSESTTEVGSNRILECMMDETGFKCLNNPSRNQSHNSSIKTLPNEDVRFEPQNFSFVTKLTGAISSMEERKEELSSTHEVLRKNNTSLKSPRDLFANNSTISSITTSYRIEKPSDSLKRYLSTLSGKVDTLSNNVVVSKKSVEVPETEKYSDVRVPHKTTQHMPDQTMSMERTILDELTGEYTEYANQMISQVPRTDIVPSKFVKNSFVKNSKMLGITTRYHTEKSSILRKLYPATPSGELDTSSNAFISKEPVETLWDGEYSHLEVPQGTTHQMTEHTMNLKTIIIPDKPIGKYTQHPEKITVLEKPSSGIDNSSSLEHFSKVGENLSSTFSPGNLNNAGTDN